MIIYNLPECIWVKYVYMIKGKQKISLYLYPSNNNNNKKSSKLFCSFNRNSGNVWWMEKMIIDANMIEGTKNAHTNVPPYCAQMFSLLKASCNSIYQEWQRLRKRFGLPSHSVVYGIYTEYQPYTVSHLFVKIINEKNKTTWHARD